MIDMSTLRNQQKSEPVDGLRAYVEYVRLAREVSQATLAAEMGFTERAYSFWLSGQTKELKQGSLLRLIVFLDLSVEDIARLDQKKSTPEEGVELAKQLLNTEEQRRVEQLIEKEGVERVVESVNLLREMSVADVLALVVQGRKSQDAES